MLDNVGPEARARANCKRWHKKRGLVKPGCPWCMQSGGPPAAPEPLVKPLVTQEAPPQQVAEPLIPEPQIDPLAEAKRSVWKDQCWVYAQSGLPSSLVCRLMGCSSEFFESEIQALFKQPWEELTVLAQLSAVADLQTSALRAARKGDFKGMIALMREGLLPQLQFSKKYFSDDQFALRSMTDDQLVERWRKLMEKRGRSIEIAVDTANALQKDNLIEIMEQTPEELLKARAGVEFVDRADESKAVSEPPKPEPVKPEQPAKPVEVSHIRPSEALRLQPPTGPVICTPDLNTGLRFGEHQYGGNSR